MNVSYANRPMKDPRDYVSKEQYNIVYNYCICTGKERDALLIRTAFETGKRIGEIVGKEAYSRKLKDGTLKWYSPIHGLRPCDIYKDAGTLWFQIEKTRTLDRPVEAAYVSKELCELLQRYIEKYKIEPSKRVFPITSGRVRQVIPKVFKEAGIDFLGERKPHSHALRHGLALDMAKHSKEPMDIIKIQRQLGHRDSNTTMYYLNHVLGSEIQEFQERRLSGKLPEPK